MPTSKAMRYAHSDGFTDICFDDSGKYILTCGSDGDVRIWDGIDDDDTISHRCGDRAFAIANKGNRYFVATDTNTIQAYTFPEGTPDGIMTRFTAPANHIVLNKSGTILIAGASDFNIKIVDVSNCSYKTCHGHEAPVLSVALDPKEEFLASSSCDGTVRLWKVSDRSQVHSLTLIPKCSDASLSKTMCRMCWEPENGQILYVPTHKEVHMYERGSWNQIGTLTDPSFTEHVSVLAVSPDGKYLAAGGSDGCICIFNIKSKHCVDKHKNEKGLSITSIAWNPKGSMELVFCDNQGQLGQLCDISLTRQKQEAETSGRVASGVFDDDDDDFLIQATNPEDTIASDDDDDDMTGVASKPTQPLFSDDDGDSIQDVKEADNDDTSSVTSDKSVPPRPEVRVEGFKPTPLQRAFQSGSTPEHLSSRFMVWNSVGVVRQYNNEDENSIDIEFHDTSIHHAMHIMNNFNYTMADMSAEAVVLATEGDCDSPSKLTCMHFSSWDNNKEWSTSMPVDEEIQSVTVGEGWLAVATETRNLRLFSMAGVQKEMFSLPGPVVCMMAHQSQLMVVYHRGMGLPGEQCLGVTLLDVREWRRDANGEPLPLSAKTTLAWAGFSAEGTPFYMDSAGIVRMFNRNAGKTWVQVANTRTHAKGKSDYYWIVGIHENPQQIRCIACKGSRYPATLPRPAPVILPFQIPLCEPSTEKSQYEELLWRTNLLSGHFDHWTREGFEYDESIKSEARKPAQEALMKLFALSARSEREARALEVCNMMTDQYTLQLAMKYSSRMRYMQLAQRISEFAVRKSEEDASKQYTQTYESEAMSVQFAGTSRAEPGEENDNVEGAQEHGEEMEAEDEERSSGPMLAIKLKEDKQEKAQNPFKNRSNPFKVSAPHASTTVTKGTQVFDGMSKKKEKPTLFPIAIKSSGSKAPKKAPQPKLFMKKKTESMKINKIDAVAPTRKTASGFDLWLEENTDRLKASKPDAEEEEFSKYAAEQFRALAKDERQMWVKKSKELKEKSKENTGDTETLDNSVTNDDSESKKRKREDTDTDDGAKKHRDGSDNDVIKKPLSQNTNSKLANFAFKQDKS